MYETFSNKKWKASSSSPANRNIIKNADGKKIKESRSGMILLMQPENN